MDHTEKQNRNPHPKEKANILSLLMFFYTFKIFKKGYKKDLEEEDLYNVLSSLRSKDLGDRLEREWEKQRRKRKFFSVFRLLWACYGKRYLLLGIMQLCVKSLIIMIQPLALSKLVSYFAPSQTNMTKDDAYFYAFLVIGVNILNCIYVHNYFLIAMSLGVEIRQAFCSFIYRKTLKLSPERLNDISIGKIITLITKDVYSFETFIYFANDIWIGFIKTSVISFVLYQKIGISAFAGVGFFFIIMPIQVYCGIQSKNLRMQMCKKSDERLQLTQETLSAIRIIKMYTWENIFFKRISWARMKEISKMHKLFYLKFFVIVLGDISGKIAFFLLIMTYIWMGNNVTAEIVYFILSCFHTLTYTLSVMFPLGLTQYAEVFASVKRIGNVLKSMEIDAPLQHSHMTIKPKVVLKDACVCFKGAEILRNINMNVDMGLNLITGTVGSGKSFLLKTILQDYRLKQGSLVTHGRISYASQEPWLFPSSIKQNILFGELLNAERYSEVLRVCALCYDLDMFSLGDSTIVEDRGINLSKGQQARINLARAVYRDADIYLLDDCLAALDTNVSDFIFSECFKKFLNNKLVILVSHRAAHVNDVDNIIIMEDGTVKSCVKPSEISEKELNNEQKCEKKDVLEEEYKDDEEAHEATEQEKLITETVTERKVYHETKQTGEVNFSVYKKYIEFGGGFVALGAVACVFVSAQFVVSYADKLVSKWVNLEQVLSNYTIYKATDSDDYANILERKNNMLKIYAMMIAGTAILTLSRSFTLFAFAKRASIKLHRYMIQNIINATMIFFDSNFIGNMLNRFSKDLMTIDETIPFVFYHVFRVLLIVIGILSLIASVNLVFLIPTAIFLAFLVFVRRCYLPTGRSLKRLDAATRSPVVGYLNATLEGLTTIRAFKTQNLLRDEFDKHQDLYTSANYTFQASMRAFAFWLDLACTCFIAIIVARFLVSDKDTLAGNVGLAISQAFLLTGTLQWGIRQWAEVENQMTSVERILEYTEIRQENKGGQVLPDWPKRGRITYKNVFLSYTNSTDCVLKNINFCVEPRQKIGIVGRTGAGKSSIISTLFRLYDVQGEICIDDVNIRTLSLDFLRSKVSIIPQDPILFSGTVRNNIDPMEKYADEEIWRAIEAAHLKPLVPALDTEIDENGANFSVGQRQLICLARAIVRNNRIIILDEATANMDPDTDALIHKTIEKNFANCTVLMIAHKLKSIMKCDKIMVMDRGEIIEFNDPSTLMENKDGIFFKMAQKADMLSIQ